MKMKESAKGFTSQSDSGSAVSGLKFEVTLCMGSLYKLMTAS